MTISRSAGKITLPCHFMLVAAMNPCPCGYLGDAKHECRCSPAHVQRYRARISGPLLDRIDLHLEAPSLSITELRSDRAGESSAAIRERIEQARQQQLIRFRGTKLMGYFFDSLLITTTSRITITMPSRGQSHMPPADHPFIHPSVWFIMIFS